MPSFRTRSIERHWPRAGRRCPPTSARRSIGSNAGATRKATIGGSTTGRRAIASSPSAERADGQHPGRADTGREVGLEREGASGSVLAEAPLPDLALHTVSLDGIESVDEQHTVEMVHLVLEHPGEESARVQAERLTLDAL